MNVAVETHIVSDLTKDEYFNFSVRMHASWPVTEDRLLVYCSHSNHPQVRAISEWGAEGEWAVGTFVQELTPPPPPMDSESAAITVVPIIVCYCDIRLV